MEREEGLLCYIIERALHLQTLLSPWKAAETEGEAGTFAPVTLLKTAHSFFANDAFLLNEDWMGEEGQTFKCRLIIHLAEIFILRMFLATVLRNASGLSFLSVELRLLC